MCPLHGRLGRASLAGLAGPREFRSQLPQPLRATDGLSDASDTGGGCLIETSTLGAIAGGLKQRRSLVPQDRQRSPLVG
jgi:hypothetical protein